MNKELIERLRNKESVFVAKDCKEAADALEAAERRIKELEGALSNSSHVLEVLLCEFDTSSWQARDIREALATRNEDE